MGRFNFYLWLKQTFKDREPDKMGLRLGVDMKSGNIWMEDVITGIRVEGKDKLTLAKSYEFKLQTQERGYGGEDGA